MTQTFLVTQTGIVRQAMLYTGKYQSWVVPSGISKLSVAMWGGGGGEYGGSGGHTTGTMAVAPGTIFTIIVGGGGHSVSAGTAAGGFGGGASGFSDGIRSAGGGGGRSAIGSETASRLSKGTRSAGTDGPRAPVWEAWVEYLTAAGGGGGNGAPDAYGGGGGGRVGATGLASTGSPSGRGGAQTDGGAALPGAMPGQPFQGGASNPTAGGGGGGGYFGGGGGGSSSPTAWGAGGGGSSYVLATAITADYMLPGENGGTQANGGALPAHNVDADPFQRGTARGGGFGASGGDGLAILVYAYEQTISFDPLADRTLDAGLFAVSASASSELPVAFASLTPSSCAVSGAQVTLLDIGTCSIEASQSGDSEWAPADPVVRTFRISGGRQTIAFAALPNAVYGIPGPPLSATATSGLPVSFASLSADVCTVSGTTITLAAIGSCTIRATQPGNTNWSPATPVDRSFLVTDGSQTLAFGPLPDQALGTIPPPLNATATSGLPPSFASTTPTVCTVAGATMTLAALGTCTIRAAQSGNSNWSAAPSVDRSFHVTQAGQTIAFGPLADQSLAAGSIAVSATASSALMVEFSSLASAVCTVSGTTVTLNAVGTCSIQAAQPGNTNYSAATPVVRSFQVEQMSSHSINFGTLADRTYGGAAFGVSATASSGLPVSFSSSTPTTCTVLGSTVTIGSAGLCTIRASQPGDLTYPAATPVDRSFTVLKAAPVITWTNPGPIVYETGLSGTQLNATANVPGSFVYTPGPGTVLAAGNSQTLSGVFTPGDAANYNNASASVAIDVNKAPATVSLGGMTFVHDGAPKPVAATPLPVGLAVNVAYDGSPAPPSAVGTYAVVATINHPNYTGSATGTLTISATVAFATSPSGLQLTVDGETAITPFSRVLTPGTHTVSAPSPQPGVSGARYAWASWSDGGAASHSINVNASTTYTANFNSQYYLSTAVSPVGAGTVTPSQWVDAGATINVSASANSGYSFSDFSGAVSSYSNPLALVMNGPKVLVANFTIVAPQLHASVGNRVVLGGLVDALIHVQNSGAAPATNTRIASITNIQILYGGTGPVSVASTLPVSLGTIPNPGDASAVVRFDWPATATGIRFTVNMTADGGYAASSTVTVDR